ncbi:MAG: TetR/AcrR family transcriptional regulator [Syntrophomonadaceae bacterium]|nr:TetR/AcrR family transcriptional regulator [Bacillota bacterium]NLP24971.1 TetR/AcrR family transcriptional regulator [Syntrophomonadaceae bacterium]
MNEVQKPGGKRPIIIEAAVQVFSEKGYHNARIEEVAVAAGIGKGTVYEYFDSKLHLFQAVMENSVELYYDSIIPVEGTTLSFEERLRRLIESHVRFCQANRELTRIVFWDTEIMDSELKDWFLSLRKEKEDQLTEVIRQSIHKGELRQFDPYLMTVMLGGIITSLWGPITLDNWSIDAAELASSITDMIMQGVSA